MTVDFESEEHFHPDVRAEIEFVAYLRANGTYDLYIYEPLGSVPELDAKRHDDHHIFIACVPDSDAACQAAEEIAASLGESYQRVELLYEQGSRKSIGRVYDELKRQGATHLFVSRVGSSSDWVLYGRRKDQVAAREIYSRCQSKRES